jgi:hypothetical protein
MIPGSEDFLALKQSLASLCSHCLRAIPVRLVDFVHLTVHR